MQKPNFLIIGAPKAGTTSLYHYLGQHPEIKFAAIKEPKYFSFRDLRFDFNAPAWAVDQIKRSTITDEDTYLKLFSDLTAPNIGEASPNYFHFLPAAENIYKFDPKMRLIVILRNPVDRLYSDWKHNIRMGWEPVKRFDKILKITESRMNNNSLPYYDYLIKGCYASHLKRFYDLFSGEQIKVVLYDDFQKDSNLVCQEIARFLGARSDFSFQTQRIHLQSGLTPRNISLYKISKKIGRLNKWLEMKLNDLNSIPEEIPAKDKLVVKDYYYSEMLELEKMIGKNFNSWLE
jgi:hypothetical protein